jgi:serine/threonine protein kinase/Flp pilus assembly protein TadD
MGEVYLAEDSRLDRTVALKILPAAAADDPERMRRFIQEAKAASALKHHNVAHIYEIGEAEGVTFIAMEYVEGQALNLKTGGRSLQPGEIVDIALQIADALDEAHSKNITHRDIKPANIMLTPRGQVKVLDFGLAKVTKPDLYAVASDAATVAKTEPGLIIGTVHYMSPEQALGQDVDHRSDIFSLGVLLYEMATGHRPFSGTTAGEIIDKIVHGEPEAIARFNYKLPAEFDRIIRKCLEKQRGRRYQSTRELLADLKNLERDIQSETALAGKLPTQQRSAVRRGSKAKVSLAVLPLTNASSDPNLDYLSDGITENIINNLSQLPKLRVMARSTVFRYKGREVDPQTVGRGLAVDAVLTGRVLQLGKQLIIGAELVDVADGSQLWGEHYNRKLSDILAMQEEIAKEISENLRLRLTGEEKKRLSKRHTENTEAYQAYLKGRYYWNKRTAEGFKKSIEHFQQAIEKDPSYALAYAGLADAHNLLGVYNYVATREAFPRAKAAATRALDLDATLAEAHTSLIFAGLYYDWDWLAAEREYKRAIELNPNYATAHQWYALSLPPRGRLEEAIVEMKRAQELDPLSLSINATLGWTYYFARQYDRAIEVCRKTLEMDKDFLWALWSLGMAYQQTGMFEEAIAEFQKARIHKDNPHPMAGLGHAYALAGKRSEAFAILDEMKEQSKRTYVPSYYLAAIHLALGQREEAFEWLENAYQERYCFLVYLKAEPMFDRLHSDPRFADLIRRVGLPP